MIERILLALGMCLSVYLFVRWRNAKDLRINEKQAIRMGCKVIGKDKKGRRIWGHSFKVR